MGPSAPSAPWLRWRMLLLPGAWGYASFVFAAPRGGLPRLGTACCACCANSARNYAFSGPLRVRYGRSRRRRVAARRLACLPLMRPGWNSNPHLEARRLPSDWRLVATVGCVRRRIKKFRLLMLSKLRQRHFASAGGSQGSISSTSTRRNHLNTHGKRSQQSRTLLLQGEQSWPL